MIVVRSSKVKREQSGAKQEPRNEAFTMEQVRHGQPHHLLHPRSSQGDGGGGVPPPPSGLPGTTPAQVVGTTGGRDVKILREGPNNRQTFRTENRRFRNESEDERDDGLAPAGSMMTAAASYGLSRKPVEPPSSGTTANTTTSVYRPAPQSQRHPWTSASSHRYLQQRPVTTDWRGGSRGQYRSITTVAEPRPNRQQHNMVAHHTNSWSSYQRGGPVPNSRAPVPTISVPSRSSWEWNNRASAAPYSSLSEKNNSNRGGVPASSSSSSSSSEVRYVSHRSTEWSRWSSSAPPKEADTNTLPREAPAATANTSYSRLVDPARDPSHTLPRTGSDTENPVIGPVTTKRRPESPPLTLPSVKKKSKSLDKLDLLCQATLEIGPLQDNPTGCSCPKSKCIALYCDCFKAGRRCDPNNCSCLDCKNTIAESGVNGARSKAIRSILARNPRAFVTAGLGKDAVKNPSSGEAGCNCIRSRCLKLYCTCFQTGKACNMDVCTCVGCSNTSEDGGGERQLAIQLCLEKRPDAFQMRVKEPGLGCACKNNRCIRKYCECFRTNLACTDKCSCRQCENRTARNTAAATVAAATTSTLR